MPPLYYKVEYKSPIDQVAYLNQTQKLKGDYLIAVAPVPEKKSELNSFHGPVGYRFARKYTGIGVINLTVLEHALWTYCSPDYTGGEKCCRG
jgi:hypothetical protein